LQTRRAATNLPPINESSDSESEEEPFDIIQGGRCVVTIMPFMKEYGELLRLIYGGSPGNADVHCRRSLGVKSDRCRRRVMTSPKRQKRDDDVLNSNHVQVLEHPPKPQPSQTPTTCHENWTQTASPPFEAMTMTSCLGYKNERLPSIKSVEKKKHTKKKRRKRER